MVGVHGYEPVSTLDWGPIPFHELQFKIQPKDVIEDVLEGEQSD